MGRTLNRTGAFLALWRQLRATRHGGPGLGARLRALPRMLGATLRRGYDGKRRVALIGLGLLYLVWPVDFVPELLLGPFGLVDDAVVLTWLAGAVISETGRFLEWEGRRAVAPPAQRRRLPGRGLTSGTTPAAPPPRRRTAGR